MVISYGVATRICSAYRSDGGIEGNAYFHASMIGYNQALAQGFSHWDPGLRAEPFYKWKHNRRCPKYLRSIDHWKMGFSSPIFLIILHLTLPPTNTVNVASIRFSSKFMFGGQNVIVSSYAHLLPILYGNTTISTCLMQYASALCVPLL